MERAKIFKLALYNYTFSVVSRLVGQMNYFFGKHLAIKSLPCVPYIYFPLCLLFAICLVCLPKNVVQWSSASLRKINVAQREWLQNTAQFDF